MSDKTIELIKILKIIQKQINKQIEINKLNKEIMENLNKRIEELEEEGVEQK